MGFSPESGNPDKDDGRSAISAVTGGDLKANPPDRYSLSFKADYVDVSSVPEPTCLLFLAPGLLGMSAIKRRFKI